MQIGSAPAGRRAGPDPPFRGGRARQPGEEGRQCLDGAGERRPYGMQGCVLGPGPARSAGGTVVRVLRGYDAVGALGAELIPCAKVVAAAPFRHLRPDGGCRSRAAGYPSLLLRLRLRLLLCLLLRLFPVPRVRAHHQRAEQHTQHTQHTPEQREERPPRPALLRPAVHHGDVMRYLCTPSSVTGRTPTTASACVARGRLTAVERFGVRLRRPSPGHGGRAPEEGRPGAYG